MTDKLQMLLQQEQDLQFTKFNAEVAWELGCEFIARAKEKNLAVTIDMTLGQQQIFHASCPGTSADNDEWVKRKVRLVNRVGHSSFYVGQQLKSKGKTIEESLLLSETEYAAHGGCFPIIIKGSGMIGTVTVSGLPQEDDHQLVVDVLTDFLKREN